MKSDGKYWAGAGVAVLVALAILLGANVYYRAVVSPQARSDFLVFHAAGKAILAGDDPYDVRHERGWRFFYPPLTAIFFVPLGLMPAGAAVVAWYVISVAALVWMHVRLAQLLGGADSDSATRVRQTHVIVLLAFFVNAGPIISGLQRGQISVLLTAILVEAMFQYVQRRDARAGLWIALAASFKVYPVLVLLVPLVRRDLRCVTAAVIGTLGLSVAVPLLVLGPSRGGELISRWSTTIALPMLGGDGAGDPAALASIDLLSPSNQSLFGVAARWLCRSATTADDPIVAVADLPLSAAQATAGVASLVLLIAVGVAAVRGGERDSRPLVAAWCAAMIASCVIPRVGWHHYFVALTPAFALLAAGWNSTMGGALGRTGWKPVLRAAALFVAVGLGWLHFASYPARSAGALLLGAMLIFALLVTRRPLKRAS